MAVHCVMQRCVVKFQVLYERAGLRLLKCWALLGDGDRIINATKAHVFTRLETEFETSCHCMWSIVFV